MTNESAQATQEQQEAAGTGPDGDPLLAFFGYPGHLIRRCKQKTTGIFTEVCKDFGVTPIQYAVLKLLQLRPGVDQAELAELAALDASTTGGVVQRLHQRGLIRRRTQGRRQTAALTPEGEALLAGIAPAVAVAQEHILHPLTPRERQQLLRLLSKMSGVSNQYYTVPATRRRRRWRVEPYSA